MTPFQRRLAENEVVFRTANRRVQRGLQEIAEDAKKEGHSGLYEGEEAQLHFHCECADEKCHERIVITPSEYEKAHANSSQFIVLPGHNMPEVERIVRETPKYIVVEKNISPPKKATELKPTGLS